MLLHIGVSDLFTNEGSFKLQFSQRGADNLCDTAFSGETYADVTAATVIAYNDNPTPADGADLTPNANDPTHGADVIVNQTYEEANNFANSASTGGTINVGQDGKWDFSLKDNSAPVSTAYCFRAVKSDGTTLNTYAVIPQITTAGAASLTFTVSTDAFPTLTPGSPVFATSTLRVNTNNSTGWNVVMYGDNQGSGSASTTMYSRASNCTGTRDYNVGITDQTEWVPGTSTSTGGNASTITAGNDFLAFRVMTASGTVSFISTAWWGSDDTPYANAKWAGAASSTVWRQIGNSSVSSGGSDALNTIQYYLDVPNTQQTGCYEAPITFTATTNP
jgi:hypothetical protein